MTRTEVLQIVGVVCLIAALVGGGVELLGQTFGVLSSRRRQLALGLLGVILIAWAPASSMVTEQRRVARSISSDIEGIATDINRGTYDGQREIRPLTDVYVRLQNERSTLGDEFYGLLRKKADLALLRANGANVDSEWDSVNDDIASRLDWP